MLGASGPHLPGGSAHPVRMGGASAALETSSAPPRPSVSGASAKEEELFTSLFWFGQAVIWVGIICSFFYVFVFLCFGQGWFSIRVSCLSLSLIGTHT